MIALVPQADGQLLSNEFLSSVVSQDVSIDIVTITRPKCNYDNNIDNGWKSIFECRSLLKSCAADIGDEFYILLCNDVLFSTTHDVSDMLAFMKEARNSDVGLVALNTKDNIDTNVIGLDFAHVSISCSLIRGAALSVANFETKIDVCDCMSLKSSLEKNSYRVVYLDHRCLRELPHKRRMR